MLLLNTLFQLFMNKILKTNAPLENHIQTFQNSGSLPRIRDVRATDLCHLSRTTVYTHVHTHTGPQHAGALQTN